MAAVYNRFDRWAKSGKWKRLFEALRLDGDDEWSSIDSTINRVHQHAAGAKGGSNTLSAALAALGDQLRRASTSILLNLAEGTGKFDKDARRFYAIARGSALECAAIIDTFEVLGFLNGVAYDQAQTLLDRIVAMLTVMIRD